MEVPSPPGAGGYSSLASDPSSESREYRGTRRGRLGSALLYSLLIHSLILLMLWAVMHRPDRRPVREVNHWVVNLVAALTETPLGPRTVLPEESHALAGPVRPNPERERPVSAAAKIPPEDSFLDFHESTPAPASPVLPERPATEPFPPVPPPGEKEMQSALLAMQESASQQMQMGQYIFRMRMGDRMAGVSLKYYQQSTGMALNGLIGGALSPEALKGFEGKSITLRILYREDGTLREISVEADSGAADLARALKEKVAWETLASPRKFGLPFQELKVRVRIDPEGKPLSRISLS